MTTHVSELSDKIIDIYRKMIGKTPNFYEIETETYRSTARLSFNVTETIWSSVNEKLKDE